MSSSKKVVMFAGEVLIVTLEFVILFAMACIPVMAFGGF